MLCAVKTSPFLPYEMPSDALGVVLVVAHAGPHRRGRRRHQQPSMVQRSTQDGPSPSVVGLLLCL